jgi:diguanylate cyclase (GGDEF)-like protein/PAS domain S-box-containing protein
MPSAKLSPPEAQVLGFRQREAVLRDVMENAAVGMALAGTNGRLIYANRAYAETFGYEPSECIGLGAGELVHPSDFAAADDELARLASGQIATYQSERRFLRKDGSSFWGLFSASALKDDRSGRPAQLIVQITDIDRQKRAEAALAESESRWNFALEGAGQGVWDHDLRNKTAFFSRMWKRMRGFAPDEIVDGSQKAWLARVHPDDRDRLVAASRLTDSGEVEVNAFEYRERHRDGHWMWILSRGKPVEWMPDGSVARIIGTDTDITDLKAVETQLAEEKERLRITLHSIGDGVISTDACGRVTFMNPVAEAMTGWPISEAAGRQVEEVFALVDEARGKTARNPVTECLERKVTFALDEDVILLSRTGERCAVGNSASPVKAATGEIIGAVLVFQDITQSRAVQRQLAHRARHDSLTGLPNRAAFEAKLLEARELARGEHREFALCFIDLDRFKAVNDSSGHMAGDVLLREVCEVISYVCRAEDFVGRMGGDEFALLLPDCSPEAAKMVAQKIIDTLSSMRFTWGGSSYEIGASIGVTAVTAESPSLATMIGEADAACYAAKAAGRNQVSIYDGSALTGRGSLMAQAV